MKVPYSEQERGLKPRTSEIIDERTWGGLVVLVDKRVDDASFGLGFPDQCTDGGGPYKTDKCALGVAIQAEVEIDWPLRVDQFPSDPLVIFDMLEYLFTKVGSPIRGSFHGYFGHYHLSYDQEAGQLDFVDAVNQVFARNGIAFELTNNGIVRRLLPEHLGGFIQSLVFHTGDAEAERLLDYARKTITLPDLERRRDELEKLWSV